MFFADVPSYQIFLLDNRYAFYYPSIIYKLDTYLFICCWCGGTFRHILIVRSRDMKIIYQLYFYAFLQVHIKWKQRDVCTVSLQIVVVIDDSPASTGHHLPHL